MNVFQAIMVLLVQRGCAVTVSEGIVTVITPDDVTWDFTVPQVKEEKEKREEKGREKEAHRE